MEKGKLEEFRGKAFISCSLRNEDANFINGIEKILKSHNIEPFGTVGKHSASPSNVAEHMKENIPKADIVVIVATPRYLQKDLRTGKESQGLSEMVHVEAGMAYMAGKPVIAFIKEGTEVGSFLPNVTQYVVLNGQYDDLKNKWKIVTSLIDNAWKLVTEKRSQENSSSAVDFFKISLAVVGGISILRSIFSSSDDENDNL